MGERANRLEARCHSDGTVVYAADVWEESHASYPERSVAMPCWPGASEGASKSSQKSAEAVVVKGQLHEGPNLLSW
jgi:hypothetical protein